MKYVNTTIAGYLLIIIILIAASCKKNDLQKDWGDSKVFMPQASITDGGITNNYAVPLSNVFNNYTNDTVKNIISINLGVYRSGLDDLKGFTVNVAADVDTTNQIIGTGTIPNAVLLPSDVYTLPGQVMVADGQRQSSFYLTIDRAKLIAKYSNYVGKKLLLTIRISNPTNYNLIPALSKTLLIIDAKTFIPQPLIINLLKGGDMSAASAANWTILQQDNSIGAGRTNASINFNGVLSWSNGSGSITSSELVYQPIQVTAGKKYKFSADVVNSGTAVNSFYELYFGAQQPIAGGIYTDNYYTGFNTWKAGACSAKAVSGNLADVGCVGPGVGAGGIFTASYTGTMYVVIFAGSYGGNLGTITLDNISIVEVQ